MLAKILSTGVKTRNCDILTRLRRKILVLFRACVFTGNCQHPLFGGFCSASGWQTTLSIPTKPD
ncbi:hypothetical protein [Eisenibacter elegans]|jgi:hypothetical protein|uniref:hypothetical protein n=1 Tax=Eisenibacter elegans TaxID=997 RepID=UPI0012B5C4B0|nr:hypothetical protein [Eisenibacter elegans]